MWKKSMLATALFCSQLMVTPPSWGVEAGERLPDFGIKSLAGNMVNRAALAGKPALIVFWNTWCENCARELPQIERLVERLAPGSLTVLAVNTGLNDSENKARAYWKKNGYRFPTGFDRSFDMGDAFRIMGVPTVVLVDANGIVRYKNSVLPADLEERVKRLAGH